MMAFHKVIACVPDLDPLTQSTQLLCAELRLAAEASLARRPRFTISDAEIKAIWKPLECLFGPVQEILDVCKGDSSYATQTKQVLECLLGVVRAMRGKVETICAESTLKKTSRAGEGSGDSLLFSGIVADLVHTCFVTIFELSPPGEWSAVAVDVFRNHAEFILTEHEKKWEAKKRIGATEQVLAEFVLRTQEYLELSLLCRDANTFLKAFPFLGPANPETVLTRIRPILARLSDDGQSFKFLVDLTQRAGGAGTVDPAITAELIDWALRIAHRHDIEVGDDGIDTLITVLKTQPEVFKATEAMQILLYRIVSWLIPIGSEGRPPVTSAPKDAGHDAGTEEQYQKRLQLISRLHQEMIRFGWSEQTDFTLLILLMCGRCSHLHSRVPEAVESVVVNLMPKVAGAIQPGKVLSFIMSEVGKLPYDIIIACCQRLAERGFVFGPLVVRAMQDKIAGGQWQVASQVAIKGFGEFLNYFLTDLNKALHKEFLDLRWTFALQTGNRLLLHADCTFVIDWVGGYVWAYLSGSLEYMLDLPAAGDPAYDRPSDLRRFLEASLLAGPKFEMARQHMLHGLQDRTPKADDVGNVATCKRLLNTATPAESAAAAPAPPIGPKVVTAPRPKQSKKGIAKEAAGSLPQRPPTMKEIRALINEMGEVQIVTGRGGHQLIRFVEDGLVIKLPNRHNHQDTAFRIRRELEATLHAHKG